MDFLEFIHTRRSVRKYQDTEVPMETIKEIIAAGTSAPSAGNQQPWHFIIITEKKLLIRIPDIHPHAKMAEDAPVAVLVCADPSLEKHKGYWVQDCAACTQNILLAVHAKGLGAVWTGVYPREERMENFRKLLKIPDNIIPFALVPMGYSVQEPSKADRYKEERVHHNKW
jgi:nitroreductase